jgi:hypothetical protein
MPQPETAGWTSDEPVVESVLRAAVAELPSVEFLTGHRLLAGHDWTDGVAAEVSA